MRTCLQSGFIVRNYRRPVQEKQAFSKHPTLRNTNNLGN